MRFLRSEYKSIVLEIEQAKLIEEDFSFVKKKGRLYVNHIESNNHFYFFRKTKTILNDNMQWEKASSFKFGIGKSENESEKWEMVVTAFRKWLKTLN